MAEYVLWKYSSNPIINIRNIQIVNDDAAERTW